MFAKIMKAEYNFNAKEWDGISNEGKYFKLLHSILTILTLAAKDFISKMLVVDPEARYTVDQCLAHPWLTGVKSDPAKYKQKKDSFNMEKFKEYAKQRKESRVN